MYTLISKEGVKFSVEQDVCFMSNVLRTAFEHTCTDEEYPLDNVDEKTLRLILELCTHHQEEAIPKIQKPLPEDKENVEIFGQWYHDFFEKINKAQLFDIVMAANFMDIPKILELCCARVACAMRGKSSDQIKEYLQ